MRSIILLALIVVGIIFYLNSHNLTFENFEYVLKTHRIIATILFMSIYIVSLLVIFPSTFFFLAGGFLFGFIGGTAIILISSTIGAILCFLSGRFLFKDWLTAKFGRKTLIFMHGVQQDGWMFVALSRMLLVVPFGFASYLFGVTNIGLVSFSVTTFFASIPAAAGYCYIGSLGREILRGGADNFALKLLIGVALVSLLAAASLFTKHAKMIKNSHLDNLS